MVVQCPKCSARFRMADEKLRSGGVKVRCSQCKEVFTATRESGPTTPMASGVEGEAALDPSMRDLGSSGDPSLQLAVGGSSHEGGQSGRGSPVPGATPLGMTEGGGQGGSAALSAAEEKERVVSQPTEAQDGPSIGGDSDAVEASDKKKDRKSKKKDAAKKKGAHGGGAPLEPEVDLRVGRGTFLFLSLLVLNGLFAFVLWKNHWQADLRDPMALINRALGESLPPPPAENSAGDEPAAAGLVLAEVKARTYVNASGESLLIVEGQVQAKGSAALEGVKIGGKLVDGVSERVILRVGVPAGVVLDAETLRGLRTPRQVARSYELAAKKAAKSLSPGASLPFSAVFASLPADFHSRAQPYRYELGIASFELKTP